MNLNEYRQMINKIHVSDQKREEMAQLLNHLSEDPHLGKKDGLSDQEIEKMKTSSQEESVKEEYIKPKLTKNLYRFLAAAACICILMTGLCIFGVPRKWLPVGVSTSNSADGTGKTTLENKGTSTSRSGEGSQVVHALEAITSKHEAVYPKSVSYDDYDGRMKIQNNNPVDSAFTAAVQKFSWKTASVILTDGSVSADANGNYSPISLYMALALMGTGAKGQTGSEMYSLLGVSGKSAAYLSTQSGNLYRLMYTDNDVGKLKIANSLWMQKKLPFGNDFINNAVAKFYCSLYSVDFADKATSTAMGEWISKNTNGILTPKIDLDQSTILSIINTIYFKDSWASPFQKYNTAKDTFTLANGKQLSCDFMNKTERELFIGGGNFTSASLGLNNGEQMVFVLPNKDTDINELLSTPEKTASLFDMKHAKTGKVVFKVPKFSFDSSMKLEETLQTLGMPTAFSGSADFSAIHKNIFITGVEQQAHIAVDEDGVEAAAYTAVECGSGPPKDEEIVEMTLNRPFVFAILSKENIPLFIGVCRNPA